VKIPQLHPASSAMLKSPIQSQSHKYHRNVSRITICFGKHCHSLHSKLSCSVHHTTGNFSSVCNEDLIKESFKKFSEFCSQHTFICSIISSLQRSIGGSTVILDQDPYNAKEAYLPKDFGEFNEENFTEFNLYILGINSLTSLNPNATKLHIFRIDR
jgi:hypothetical protein